MANLKSRNLMNSPIAAMPSAMSIILESHHKTNGKSKGFGTSSAARRAAFGCLPATKLLGGGEMLLARGAAC